MTKNLLFVILSLSSCTALLAGGWADLRPGVWSWACGYASYAGSKPPGYYVDRCFEQALTAPPSWLRGWFPIIYWRDLEPEDGVFNWAALDANLTKAAEHGLQVQPVVYIFDCATPMPTWMNNVSTPVKFHKGGKTGPVHSAPNYVDPAFQARWQRVIQALASHLAELPPAVRAAVWSVQAVAGITGDNRPYNGVAVDPAEAINASTWEEYSRRVAAMFIDAAAPLGLPVTANLHDGFSGQQDQPWFLERAYAAGMRGAAIKEGGVSHWYNVNGEQALYDAESPLLLLPQPDGSYARSRGELAVEPDPTNGTYGNWATSPWWSLQALAEWGLTFGLDVWNLYAGFLGNASFAPTMEFFNRHAGHRDAATAPAAFLSFRDSLDTADVVRWPEATFGPVNSTKNPSDFANKTRMLLIAAEHAARGARLDDPNAASSKAGVHQKKAMSLLDVCWQCFSGNYGRFVKQVDPLGSSVGWWQLGPHDEPYGRFARGLEHSTGKTVMQLQLDPKFGASGRAALARVVYFDLGRGSWALGCNGARVAVTQKHDSRSWRTAEANLTLGNGTLLTLSSLAGEDDVFSLLEILLWPL